jgi:RimJ/RimL family protein N-acetyltransferase
MDMSIEVSNEGEEDEAARQLPPRIAIPMIYGEMLELHPATLEDFSRMDEVGAFLENSTITSRNCDVQRKLEEAFVVDSIAWNEGVPTTFSTGARTIAWSMFSTSAGEGKPMPFLGMIFLTDIDGWSRSARIQVVLGAKYRGRGYSRDAMPRVMTYAFASRPVGLGLQRIWVSIPEKNHRTREVYQSLGFIPEGVLREALWDEDEQRYQDRYIFGSLSEEYDPVRALDAYGMTMNPANPGVKEALAAHEHSVEIRQHRSGESGSGAYESVVHVDAKNFVDADSLVDSEAQLDSQLDSQSDSDEQIFNVLASADLHDEDDTDSAGGGIDGNDTEIIDSDSDSDSDGQLGWPYVQGAERGQNASASKRAWWRNIGRSRSRKVDKADNKADDVFGENAAGPSDVGSDVEEQA